MYSTGLVLGKFMPLHKGHLALVEFALQHCHELIILLCVHEGEPIPSHIRMQWLSDEFSDNPRIKFLLFEYDPSELTNQSVAPREESHRWGKWLKMNFPQVKVFFTSERYGEVVTEVWPVAHVSFNPDRNLVPVSATAIRECPLSNWDFIPNSVRPFFVKKIILCGTESTGKTVLAKRLADHFSTCCVEEAARDIVDVTEECTEIHLEQIAIAHAQQIQRQTVKATKLLFVDTDINVTRSYSKFLFQKEMWVAPWIEDINKGHLYLFLEPDAPFVQDGTRLSMAERNRLSEFHKSELKLQNIQFTSISGDDWDSRFYRACQVVDDFIRQF